MNSQVARGWRVHAVRGVAAIIFGVAALVWPAPTLTVAVYLFGAFAFTDGVALIAALARGDVLARRHGWATGVCGVAGILVAVVTLVWPDATALGLLYLVAFWATLTGLLQIITAIELRHVIRAEFWVILSGALSIAFGALLMADPGTGLVSLVWLLGCYAIMFGATSIGVSHSLRRLEDALRTHPSASVA
jgi:uncharacterized membrane protein HdeD (DUF308 family)